MRCGLFEPGEPFQHPETGYRQAHPLSPTERLRMAHPAAQASIRISLNVLADSLCPSSLRIYTAALLGWEIRQDPDAAACQLRAVFPNMKKHQAPRKSSSTASDGFSHICRKRGSGHGGGCQSVPDLGQCNTRHAALSENLTKWTGCSAEAFARCPTLRLLQAAWQIRTAKFKKTGTHSKIHQKNAQILPHFYWLGWRFPRRLLPEWRR